MSTQLPIGDFSKMTYLSVKALRRYHNIGLLVPAVVDPDSGYRYYEPSQVPIGQVVRRFRDLGMPLDQIKEVLGAPDSSARDEVIVSHLRRMEEDLEQTQRTVASLRSLLERARPGPVPVEYRTVPGTRALAIVEPVRMADGERWWGESFDELHGILSSVPDVRAGPDGALYPSEFFENELGDVTVFVPVAGDPLSSGRAQLIDIPRAELAVTVHEGAFSEIDQTYGALGTFVAQREIAVEGPIREHYPVSSEHTGDESQHRTEVCWPVFHTRPAGSGAGAGVLTSP